LIVNTLYVADILVNFYRAMHYSAQRSLGSHVVCLSLCVTLVDQDHICSKSWKLIAQTISPTPSLFVAQSYPPTPRGTWRNFGETRGVAGKVAC